MFTNKDLIKLIVPLVIEQLLSITVGLADSLMVSRIGESAVSGISLIDTVSILLIMIFSAMSTGGAVVVGQYIGQKNEKKANEAADQLILFVFLISLVITGCLYFAKDILLSSVFGKIEPNVRRNAEIYLMITAASIPFLAVYNGGAAIFRAEGNSRISMITSLFMNSINVIGNAILIFGFKRGVEGAAIPTLISRVFAAIMILCLLRNQELQVHLSPKIRWKIDYPVVKKILHLGIPSALENSIFQLGKILVLSLVASFGTSSIAANAVGNAVATFQVLPGMAVNLAVLTVIAQCVGAGNYDQVRYYTKKLVIIIYGMNIVVNMIIFALIPTIVGFYHLSDTTFMMTEKILRYHGVMAILVWPLSFTLPNTLRAANDVKYTMWVSIISMWVCRILLSYVIGKYLGFGVFGVWVAMTIDWCVRSIFFIYRFYSGKWIRILTE